MTKKHNGILFWITGLSGSGKTSIAKKILPQIIKNYGPTVLFSGDDVRNITSTKGYSIKDRKILLKKYCRLAKFITNQNINVLFAVVGLMNEPRNWNRKNFKKYLEIYIKSNLKTIIKKKRKKIYYQHKKNIVGLDIKAEYPKKPHIIINNTFKKDIDFYSKDLMIKIKKYFN